MIRGGITTSVFFATKFQIRSVPPPILYTFLNISNAVVIHQSYIDASTDGRTYVTLITCSSHLIGIYIGRSLQQILRNIQRSLSIMKIPFTDIIIEPSNY